MKKVSLLVSVVMLGMGTSSSVFHAKHQSNFPSANENISRVTDGAFRDGLYLGKLAAKRGIAPHVASGRWATESDRASFTAGYQQGYEESLANQMAR